MGGRAGVWLDGVNVQVVDFHADTSSSRELYRLDGLAPGGHHSELVVLQSGGKVAGDAVDVRR